VSSSLVVLLVLACVVGNAIFSSAETAWYRASRVRLEMEERRGSRAARAMLRLARSDTASVVLFVLGVNVCVESSIFLVEGHFDELQAPGYVVELVMALVLTPLFFLFGDLVPKEIARRRPHATLRLVGLPVATLRVPLYPLELLLRGIVGVVGRLVGTAPREEARIKGREAVLSFIAEGRKSGALPAQAEELARNVLLLRSIPLARCVVPWKDVEHLDAARDDEALYAQVARSTRTRLPWRDEAGRASGYLHQLDALGSGDPRAIREQVRPLLSLPGSMPVDKALVRMRAAGVRIALVGEPAAPLGIVTLKDLLEEISGPLVRW
jgi:CBS domain containing-hemolysin-like protein